MPGKPPPSPYRELMLSAAGALLSLAAWVVQMPWWIAWTGALVATVWLGIACYVVVTGRPSPL